MLIYEQLPKILISQRQENRPARNLINVRMVKTSNFFQAKKNRKIHFADSSQKQNVG
jgi:hypothetical protein